MKRLALLAFTAAVVLLPLSGAKAQQAPDVNCAALSGTPLMCVKNASPFSIVGIQAITGNAFNPSAWIPISGGPIAPGGTAIVKFPTWSGCVQTVFVRTSSGTTHPYFNTNVCAATSFVIRGW